MQYTAQRLPQSKLLARGTIKGIAYMVVSHGTFPEAFVGLPENHPFYEMGHRELDYVKVHGGLTWSGRFHPKGYFGRKRSEDDRWWLGWDYAHGGDCFADSPEGIRWTVREMKAHCRKVIDQLVG